MISAWISVIASRHCRKLPLSPVRSAKSSARFNVVQLMTLLLTKWRRRSLSQSPLPGLRQFLAV